MDKKQRRLYTTTIYAVGFLQMGGVGISPVLDELSKAFPQYSTTAIQFTSSIVSLFVVLTNLITGWLCARFPKKYLTAFGCGLAVLFALLATIFNSSLPQLYLWAALLGIGTSIASTVSMAIVNEMFEPEECVSVFGIRACFSSVGAMLMTFISGRLVGINWWYGFLVYLGMLPGLLLSLLWFPKDTKIAKSNASASNAPFSVKKAGVSLLCGLLCFDAVQHGHGQRGYAGGRERFCPGRADRLDGRHPVHGFFGHWRCDRPGGG